MATTDTDDERLPEEPRDLPGDDALAVAGDDPLADLGDPARGSSESCILRGFDPESGLATFVRSLDGEHREFTVLVSKDDPLYRRNYETLLACISNDKGPRALHVRITTPPDGSGPGHLLLATPIAKDLETRFRWKGEELHWSRALDHAVDVDFDRRADSHAGAFLSGMLNSSAPESSFSQAREEARAAFMEEAAVLGLGGAAAALFEKYAARTLGAVILGIERVGAAERPVRYDTRYSFRQQSAHVPAGDPEAMASALANYCAQKGVALCAAREAFDSIGTPDGQKSSLADAHQRELMSEAILLAPNPALGAHHENYASYSFESVRNAVAGNLAGMMDAAGVAAARPALDAIEFEKKNRSPSDSKHLQVLAGIPAEAQRHADPLVRAGAYLRTSTLLEDDFRTVSKQRVADAQRLATPALRHKADALPNELGRAARKAVENLEQMIDVM